MLSASARLRLMLSARRGADAGREAFMPSCSGALAWPSDPAGVAPASRAPASADHRGACLERVNGSTLLPGGALASSRTLRRSGWSPRPNSRVSASV